MSVEPCAEAADRKSFWMCCGSAERTASTVSLQTVLHELLPLSEPCSDGMLFGFLTTAAETTPRCELDPFIGGVVAYNICHLHQLKAYSKAFIPCVNAKHALIVCSR